MSKLIALTILLASGLGATGEAAAQFLLDDSYPSNFTTPFADVHALAADKLRDPRSAQYKGFVVASDAESDLVVLCSWMNWKDDETGIYGPFLPMVYLKRRSGEPLGDGSSEAAFTAPPEVVGGAERPNPTPGLYGCPQPF